MKRNYYIMSIPLISILMVISIISYVFLGHSIAIGLLTFIGITEAVLAKFQGELLFKNSFKKYYSLVMLLIPSSVFLFLNNNTEGFYIGSFIGIIIFLVRIYFSLKKIPIKEKSNDKRIKIIDIYFSLGFTLIILVNIYCTNFYNNQNRINWETPLNGALTSNIKILDSNIKVLGNNDLYRKNYYNLPQTFILDSIKGIILSKKGGYEFEEEFQPYKGKVNKITYKNIEISGIENIIYFKDLNSKKVISKFIANGKILSTPIIDKNNLYFVANDWSWLDKRKKSKIYSLDISNLKI